MPQNMTFNFEITLATSFEKVAGL